MKRDNCEACGAAIPAPRRNQRYCTSKECRRARATKAAAGYRAGKRYRPPVPRFEVMDEPALLCVAGWGELSRTRIPADVLEQAAAGIMPRARSAR